MLGEQFFSELDMSEAYTQVELDEGSRSYTTINRHKGLYQYRRFPYGMKSAASLIQRIIKCTLAGILNVLVFLDNILITGKRKAEHQTNLYEDLNSRG